MKFKGLAAVALATSITISSTFAAPVLGNVFPKSVQKPKGNALMVVTQVREECEKVQDPIKFLENKKAKLQQMVTEGEITQEEANAKIARIDEKIKKIEEFNKLSVPEKKETLINHYKEMLDKKVESGKLKQQEADERLKAFTEKVNEWDGTGYPKFGRRGHQKR